MPRLKEYKVPFVKSRFQKPTAPSPALSDSAYGGSDRDELTPSPSSMMLHKLQLSEPANVLFIKALHFILEQETAGHSKELPLQGIIDTATGTLFLAALTPRDAESLDLPDAEPKFMHKQPGLFQSGRYSPRLESYQSYYPPGNPTAHQQLMLHATGGDYVSADDAKHMLGIALKIQIVDGALQITIDGKSLSTNQTAQYLRTKHKPGHSLSKAEADNKVLKASGQYSDLCESWVFDHIKTALETAIEEFAPVVSGTADAAAGDAAADDAAAFRP
jgi:hypothetical protein